MKVHKCPPPPKVEATPFPWRLEAFREGRLKPHELPRFGYEVHVDSARPFSVSEPIAVSENLSVAKATMDAGGWIAVSIIDRRARCVVGYGVARCNPVDEWDDKRGLEIAYGRAYRQAFGR